MTISLQSGIIECKLSSDNRGYKGLRHLHPNDKATLPHVDSRNFDICIRVLSPSLQAQSRQQCVSCKAVRGCKEPLWSLGDISRSPFQSTCGPKLILLLLLLLQRETSCLQMGLALR